VRRNKPGTHHVDVYPLIWKDFTDNGYVTLFGEDLPEISLFSLRFNGFDKVPVDHYMRPFWLAVQKSTIRKRSGKYCIGAKAKHLYTLDYVKEFFEKYQRVPKFAFGFHTQLSHAVTYPVQHIGKIIVRHRVSTTNPTTAIVRITFICTALMNTTIRDTTSATVTVVLIINIIIIIIIIISIIIIIMTNTI